MADVEWKAAYAYLELQYELTLRSVADRMAVLEESARHGSHVEVHRVDLETREGRLRATVVSSGPVCEYAFYIYNENELLLKVAYSSRNTVEIEAPHAGKYRVRGFARPVGSKEPQSKTSRTLSIVGK